MDPPSHFSQSSCLRTGRSPALAGGFSRLPWNHPPALRTCRHRGLRAQGKRDLLRQLEERRDVEAAAAALRAGKKLNSAKDFTTLISAYGAVGKWRQALSAFDEMQKQGIEAGTFGYSAVIRALGRKQQWESALMLLEEACAQGIQSDTALFSSAMKACDLDSERVLRLFSDMQDADLVPDMQSYGIAIGSCCYCQQWPQALALLTEARVEDLEPDAATVALVMQTLTRNGQWQRALEIWKEFGEAEMEVESMSFTTAIQAYAAGKAWRGALQLLSDMHQEDLTPGTVPCSAAMAACCGVQEWEVALELFRSARKSRAALDAEIYTSAIQSCGAGQQWQAALGLYDDMEVPNKQAHGALVAALGAAGRWERALVVFGEMAEKGLDVDVDAYSSMITAAELSKKWPWALHFLEEMREEDVQPDTTSYNSAISASAKSGKWRVAVALLQEMEECQVPHDVETYAFAILACLSGRKWQVGLELLDKMPLSELEPDSLTYGMLLSECEQRGTSGKESELVRHLAMRRAGGRASTSRSAQVTDEEEPDEDEEDEDELDEEFEAAAPVTRSRRGAAKQEFKPIPCTSAMNAQRVKGRAVPGQTPGRISGLVEATPLPARARPGPLVRPTRPIRAGKPYSKELRLLQHVVERAERGNPKSICETIESFGDEVLVRGKARLWLKIAGGVKTEVLTAAVKGGPLTRGDLQCSVLEVGAYCGYSSTRMALALPGVHIASLEVDPVHVVIARNVVLHAGLQGTIDVWTGHSKDLLARIKKRYNGDLSFGAVFMDQKGSRYGEDMLKMESEGLLHPGAVVVADNVLKPGAPRFLFQIMNGGRYNAQIVSMDEFAMPSEDWMSINVRKMKAPKNETEPPEDLHQLSKETDRMRERATGPGRSVTYEEWAEFAQEVKKRLAATDVKLTVDLRPEDSRERDASFGMKYKR